MTKYDTHAQYELGWCASLDILERSSPKKPSLTKVPGNLVRASSRKSPMPQWLQNHCNMYLYLIDEMNNNLTLNPTVELDNIIIRTLNLTPNPHGWECLRPMTKKLLWLTWLHWPNVSAAVPRFRALRQVMNALHQSDPNLKHGTQLELNDVSISCSRHLCWKMMASHSG